MLEQHPLTVRHYLSEKNLEARTAICSVCGPTKIRPRGKSRERCIVAHRAAKRRDRFRILYGINWREWESMLIAQSGRCAICFDPMKKPVVDHCHKTGRVRGLLCGTCNTGIGMFKDNPALLRVALDYLAE